MLEIIITHVTLVIDGDFLHFGLDLRHPRRIDHRQGFYADLRRRQSELYSRWRHFEGEMGRLFHPRPYLISQFPQHLKSQDRVDAHAGVAVLQALVHQIAGLVRRANGRYDEERRGRRRDLLIRLEQEFPRDRQHLHEHLLRHDDRAFDQCGQRRVKGVLHLRLYVL